ncbi:MAG TPA: bifunctional 2-C-methyl-D-erythritol 4-phosphate cytidylyltransferase/2-C-methyl-D-erythritol 2,4-cyclodiphosphate synthase [Allosphingosinicella sp.]|nr:bifunctional 2-C-methyl-D-erythritol 4-phosphate cytidylyltransferase/2-C-methyl-D-erythritol 2,4-cyclodiphosphate synthase [Allosphingosinicella sp.]
MTRIAGLVVAAGSGSRAGGGPPKQYRRIAGRALLAHAVDGLAAAGVEPVQVVIGEGQEVLYASAVEGRALPHPVIGGVERQDSVKTGLDALEAAGAPEFVLIHDSARPFVPAAVVRRLLGALEGADGAVPVLPVADTLARGDSELTEAVSRDGLLRVQTPQAFRFEAIRDAHRRWSGPPATDDAQIARAAGYSVATVEGDPRLDKLTWQADFARAEREAAARLVTRTGLGFDVHAFAEGDGLWLGGLRLPHPRSLKGHSDADVLLHAVADALLGALGEGDIGDHFRPGDPQWKGAASSLFIEHVRGLAERAGALIDHVDATIICEEPRIGPHRRAMRERLAALLRVPVARISIKATTTERLGFTGRGEGMAAQAIATLRVPEDEE